MAASPEMQRYLEGRWADGTLIRPQHALVMLSQNPGDFLRKYPLTNTFDCTAHGPARAYIANGSDDAKRPGTRLGTAGMKSTQAFSVETVSGANAYGVPFDVHGVYTSQSSAGPLWYRLGMGGPPFMFTAKLTGCTFVARAGAGPGEVEVTHLQPHQETGLALNARMQGPGQSAYGRLRYEFDKRSINIVGARVGGRWQIWAQKLVKNSTAPTVLSCNRIWPL